MPRRACCIARLIEGTRALDEIAAGVQKTDMRMLETEVHRLRGELILLDGSNAGRSEDALPHRAAHRSRARRASHGSFAPANSLARLMLDQGRHDEARAILEPVYNWFTEGFATGDLQEAKALLDRTLSRRA